MSTAKKSGIQLERERQERLDQANIKRERAEITKALLDQAVMRDVKNYLVRKGVLDEEGKCAVGETRVKDLRSQTPRPRVQAAGGEESAGSVSKLLRGGRVSAKSMRFNELTVHRNFSTWGSVPPQLLRLLFGELCPGQLNFHALKASYSNVHQKEISRTVADQLFEYLTGQRKEANVGDVRDLPSLLKVIQGWHEQRGRPGERIDGRCDFKNNGVYQIETCEGEQSKTHLQVIDRVRRRNCQVALSLLEGVSVSSLHVETNYSDRHATIASIEKANMAVNIWDLFSDRGANSAGHVLPASLQLQTPVAKRRRKEETCCICPCQLCCPAEDGKGTQKQCLVPCLCMVARLGGPFAAEAAAAVLREACQVSMAMCGPETCTHCTVHEFSVVQSFGCRHLRMLMVSTTHMRAARLPPILNRSCRAVAASRQIYSGASSAKARSALVCHKRWWRYLTSGAVQCIHLHVCARRSWEVTHQQCWLERDRVRTNDGSLPLKESGFS
eukprot:2499183-Amphidinium_carterae.3